MPEAKVYRFTSVEVVSALIIFAVSRGESGPAGYSLAELILEGSPAEGFTLTLPAHTQLPADA